MYKFFLFLLFATTLTAQPQYSFPCDSAGFFDSSLFPGIISRDFEIKTGSKCGREVELVIDFHTYQVPDRIGLLDDNGVFILLSPWIGGEPGSGYPIDGHERVMDACWVWNNGDQQEVNSRWDLPGPGWPFPITTFTGEGSARIILNTSLPELTLRAYYNPYEVRTFFDIYIHCIDESSIQNPREIVEILKDTCGLSEDLIEYSLVYGACVDTLYKTIYTDLTIIDHQVDMYGCIGDNIDIDLYNLVPSVLDVDGLSIYPNTMVRLDNLGGDELVQFELDYLDCTSLVDVYVHAQEVDTIDIYHYAKDRGAIVLEDIIKPYGLTINMFDEYLLDTDNLSIGVDTIYGFLSSSNCIAPYVNVYIIDNYNLYIPNVIYTGSSNIDNSVFKVYDKLDNPVVDVCNIYNRWGGLVYSVSSGTVHWDGANVQSGVYVYYIQYKGREYKGDVLVLK